VRRAQAFQVAVPSWGLGTGGTRFARFPGSRRAAGHLREARGLRHGVQARPLHARGLAPHSLGQAGEPSPSCVAFAEQRGLVFDAMNSNTFQDQPEQGHSYKFGSLTPSRARGPRAGRRPQRGVHRDRTHPRARRRTPSGSETAGTSRARWTRRRTLDRYLESMRAIYAALPDGLARLHGAQALRARVLLDGHQRLGRQLPLRARAGARRPSAWWTSATTRRT
jgi:L-rhamnose isomerase/sugar isomerase